MEKDITTPSFLSCEDKKEQFKKELKALLVKYKAEVTLENFGSLWKHDEKIVIDFVWDKDLYDKTDSGSVPQWVVGRWENGMS